MLFKMTVILQYVNASIIQNCEFSLTDTAVIIVEGLNAEKLNNKIVNSNKCDFGV